MNVQQLKVILESFDCPVTFHHFDRPVEPPFLVWHEESSQNVNADLQILRPVDTFTFDFYYTGWKQRKRLEEHLTRCLVPWQRSETDTWIASEKMFRSGYEIGEGL